MIWIRRRGQIKHALYVSCLNGWIPKSTFEEMLEDLNTVEPVKHGRWKGAGMGDYMCSLCAEVVSGNRYQYCPNCGADMREVTE